MCLLWLWLRPGDWSLKPPCSEVIALVCFFCSPAACVYAVVCISLYFVPVCPGLNAREPTSTSCLLSNEFLYFLWWIQFHGHSLYVFYFTVIMMLFPLNSDSGHPRVSLLVSYFEWQSGCCVSKGAFLLHGTLKCKHLMSTQFCI